MAAVGQSKRLFAGVCFFAFSAGLSNCVRAQTTGPVIEPNAEVIAEPTAAKMPAPAPAPATADNGGRIQKGKISYYSTKFNGRKTANGEIFDSNQLTMAHRTLPFGTLVEVTHAKNKRSVIVRVNDRGPAIASRIGDLSRAAAIKLGIVHSGLAQVTLKVIGSAGSHTSTIKTKK